MQAVSAHQIYFFMMCVHLRNQGVRKEFDFVIISKIGKFLRSPFFI